MAARMEVLDPMLIICQGPPRCMLEGEAAIAAQDDGCVWCERRVMHKDGSVTVTGPIEA